MTTRRLDIAYEAGVPRRPTDHLNTGYEPLRAKITATETLATQTLLIQGEAEFCDPPGETAGDHRFFTGGYDRVVLDGSGTSPLARPPRGWRN